MDIRRPESQDPPTGDEMSFLAALHEPALGGMRLLAFRVGWWARQLTPSPPEDLSLAYNHGFAEGVDYSEGRARKLPIDGELARLLADNAIGLFLECRDDHGHSEREARALAISEVVEGATTVLDDETPPEPPFPQRVEDIARKAIFDRLSYAWPQAIRAVDVTADGVTTLHFNSGGNALAARNALRAAGVACNDEGGVEDPCVVARPPQVEVERLLIVEREARVRDQYRTRDLLDEAARLTQQAWDEGFEAGGTYVREVGSAPVGPNGPSDPPANPYVFLGGGTMPPYQGGDVRIQVADLHAGEPEDWRLVPADTTEVLTGDAARAAYPPAPEEPHDA
jgi:hypothetical protein